MMMQGMMGRMGGMGGMAPLAAQKGTDVRKVNRARGPQEAGRGGQ